MTVGKEVQKTFGVTEFIEALNIYFKRQDARIVGEICEFKVAASGHVYFTLKDKEGNGVLDCIMWRSTYALCGIKMEVGMEIIVNGHPQIYAPSGRLSLICESIELVGEGALKKAYDALRLKLDQEGLFDPEKKRPVPEFVHKIGVITSREGAVIHDFVNNLGKFGYKVTLVDSRVEGQTALKDLNSAIKTMRKQDIEVLVVIRGGGSLESLQAFNNEALIRELCSFPVPVIAGIGHDKDVPLLALVADHMTSTPTAAAHLINRSWEEAYAKIRQVSYLTSRIENEFPRIRKDLETAWASVIDHTSQRLKQLKDDLKHAEQVLKLNDPARQLKLGYSIVRSNNKVLRNASDTAVGETISIQLADGSITSEVQQIN